MSLTKDATKFPANPSDVTLDTVVPEARLFSAEATVSRSNAAVFGSDTDGIIDPTESPYPWANALWKQMRGNEWGPEEVDITKDVKVLRTLSKRIQDSYEKALHALITNDSQQTRNLAMSISPFISDGMVLSCVSRQDYEEALHSFSYDYMVKDVAIDRTRLYNMHKTDEFVKERAEYLEKMYAPLAYSGGKDVTMRMIIRALIANNILEGIMFYAGFIFFWALDDELPGSSRMISFIARDEKTHIILFRKMLLSTLENYPGIDRKEVEEMAREMVRSAAELEKRWLRYIAEGVLHEFTPVTIDWYINGKADSIMRGLKMKDIYGDPVSPLSTIEDNCSDPNKMRSNFFESTSSAYTATPLSYDDYLEDEGEIHVYNP